MAENETIVVDLGSSLIRAGFAGEDAPRSVFPNIIGGSRLPIVMCGATVKQNYVGDEAQARRGLLALRYPIENGKIMEWDALEQVLRHTFDNELRRDPHHHPVLMSEQPLGSRRDRETLCQLMFETFNVPAYHAALCPILATNASGRNTALVVDVGDGVMTTTPITRGYAARQANRRVHFSGRDLTHYLTRLLIDRGYYFTRSSDFETVRELKEKLCYVPLDYEAALHRSLVSTELDKNYELPDGQIITLGHERFTCPEALFQPSLVGREGPGIHELVFDAINSCTIDSRKELWGNIVLTGGTTMLNGFADRMHKEMTQLAPSNMEVRIIAPPERKYSVWIGGSLLARIVGVVMLWICKEEYDETGPAMVHRKCYAGD